MGIYVEYVVIKMWLVTGKRVKGSKGQKISGSMEGKIF